MKKKKNEHIVEAHEDGKKRVLFKLSSSGYIVAQYSAIGYYRRHDCFKKQSLRQAILNSDSREGRRINFKRRLRTFHEEPTGEEFIGLHFRRDGVGRFINSVAGAYGVRPIK